MIRPGHQPTGLDKFRLGLYFTRRRDRHREGRKYFVLATHAESPSNTNIFLPNQPRQLDGHKIFSQP